MYLLGLFTWWYGAGWVGALKSSGRRLRSLANTFSIGILLRTLFAPWRRIVTYPGASLDAKLRAMGDNLVSRCIGFTVRFFVLLAAGVAFVVLAAVSLVEIVAWPLVPLAAVALVVEGLL
jgi:hypothetical protein